MKKKKYMVTKLFANLVLELGSVVRSYGVVGGICKEDKQEFVDAYNSMQPDAGITIDDVDWKN